MPFFLKSSVVLLIISLFLYNKSTCQICRGSLGDPVVNINFGSGNNPGAPLTAILPNLNYTFDACPNDGNYTIVNNTRSCFGASWHNVLEDHTPNDNNGYMMLINASFNSGDFYVDTVKGLCGGTTYEFAAWVLNVLKSSACMNNGITPNLTFNIESTSGSVLGTFKTGVINQSASPNWQQFGLFFTTLVNTSDVVLRITNTAPGGCGNDLILDDITFRPCGPLVNAVIPGSNPSATATLCVDNQPTLHFSASVSQGYNNPSYQWQVSTNNGVSWQDITNANTLNFSRSPTPPGSYLYRLAVAESGNIGVSNCRVASNPISVMVNEMPVTTANNDGPQCPGSTINLSAVGGDTYLWTGPNGFTANTANVPVNNASGKFYVTVTKTGCSKTDSTIVTRFPKPIAAFNPSSPACIKNGVIFSDQSNGGPGETVTGWKWNFGDGAMDSIQTVSHVFDSTNVFQVSLMVTNSKNCKDTVVQSVRVHPLPNPAFGLPEVCLSDPFARFPDSSSIADNSEAGFSYHWDFGDAHATVSNPNTSTQKNPQHSYRAVGIYQVTLSVTSRDGCINDTTQAFTVNGALPLANFTIDSSNMVCSNNPVLVSNLSSVNFGSVTRVEIFWDYQNNPSSKTIDEQPFDGKQYRNQYPVFGTPLTKNVQVKLVAYSGISCLNEVTKTVTLKAAPLVRFDSIPPVCSGVPSFAMTRGYITNSLAGSGNYTGNGINASGLFDPGRVTPGIHLLRYTYIADNSCVGFAEQPIKVFQQPTANAGPDRTLLEGGFITLQASASGTGNGYLWAPNVAIDDNKVLTPKVYPTNDQLYQLKVTSADGCSSLDEVFVKVLKTPVVPNAFSPNGDGINDSWVIRNLDSYASVEVQVFDRYGQLVFKEKGYNKPWDGNHIGKPLPAGTYYYLIDRKIGGASKLSGSVSIIR